MAQTAYESGKELKEYVTGLPGAIGRGVKDVSQAVASSARRGIESVVQPATDYAMGVTGQAPIVRGVDMGREGMRRPGQGEWVTPQAPVDFGREGIDRPVAGSPAALPRIQPAYGGPAQAVSTARTPSPVVASDSQWSAAFTPRQRAESAAAEDRSAAQWRNDQILAAEQEKQQAGMDWSEQHAGELTGSETLTGLANKAIQRKRAAAAGLERQAGKKLASDERLAAMREAGEFSRLGMAGGLEREKLGSAERIAALREAGESGRYTGARGLDLERIGLEREKLAAALPGYASESRLREAQTGLAGAQAETAGYAAKEARRTDVAKSILANRSEHSPEQVAQAQAIMDKALQDKIAFEQAKARAKYEAENASYATGGEVEGYAKSSYLPEGGVMGAIKKAFSGKPAQPAPTASPTPAPAPVAQDDYSMRLSPEEEASAMGGWKPYGDSYADGGAINMLPRANPVLAKYGQYLQAASASGVEPVPFDQYSSLLAKTQGQMQQTPAAFAEGGAVPVAGKVLEGPGTETSDSIPAVIDGARPAALSTGEFVIPAHIVRAKGTEFFDKLLAQYADKGENNG